MKSVVISIVAWASAGALYLLVRFAGVESRTDWASTSTGLVSMWIFASIFLGLSYSFSLSLSKKPSVRRRSYSYIIVYRSIVVLLSLLILVFFSRVLAVLQGQISWLELLPTFAERITATPTLVVLLYFVITTAIISFFNQMGSMVGTRVLLNLMMGKYHLPREENRIFMFLDMRSSTTHAERLGHIKFCRLIQDCFSDLTDAVKKT